MNATVEKRKKNLEKIQKKCKTVKQNQLGVCKFVEVRVQTFKQEMDGSWVRTGMAVEQGLQYENRVKLVDGRLVYLNKSGTKIVTEYQGIPLWATKELEDIFIGYDMFDTPVPF